jgi:hypothetical protein
LLNYLLHDAFKGLDPLRDGVYTDVSGEFKILRRFAIIRRPTRSALEVRHPPRSGWLDELDRLKGGWLLGLGVALKRALG